MLAGRGIVRAGYCANQNFIKSKSKIKRYYQHENRFNGVCLRNNMPNKKDRACVINLDKYKMQTQELIGLLYISILVT